MTIHIALPLRARAVRLGTRRPFHLQIGKRHIQPAVRLLALGPRHESSNRQMKVTSRLAAVDPTDLTHRQLPPVSGKIIDPEADRLAARVHLPLDRDADVLLGGDRVGVVVWHRGDAPVGPAVAGDGAQPRHAVVQLEAGLDPLALVGGVVGRLAQGQDQAGLIVLLLPLCGECYAGGEEV